MAPHSHPRQRVQVLRQKRSLLLPLLSRVALTLPRRDCPIRRVPCPPRQRLLRRPPHRVQVRRHWPRQSRRVALGPFHALHATKVPLRRPISPRVPPLALLHLPVLRPPRHLRIRAVRVASSSCPVNLLLLRAPSQRRTPSSAALESALC